MADLMEFSKHTKGVLITLLGVIIITPDTLLIRLVSADQWTNLFWRGGLSGVTILVALAAIYKQTFLSRIRAMGMPGLWFTIISAIGSVAFILAVKLTTVANALFIISISPLFSALISRFLLKQQIHARIWWAIFSALVGISIIAWGTFHGEGNGTLFGDVAALIAAMSLAIIFSIANHYHDRDMVPAMAFANLLSALVALPLIPAMNVFGSIDGQDILWLGLMGFVVVPLSFSLLTIGPRYLPAPEVGLFLLLEAVIGPYWVWLVLGEHPGDMTIIGGAIILLTLTVMNIFAIMQGRRKRARMVA